MSDFVYEPQYHALDVPLEENKLDQFNHIRDGADPDDVGFALWTLDTEDGNEIARRFYQGSSMLLGVVEMVAQLTSVETKYNDNFVIVMVTNKEFHHALVSETIRCLLRVRDLVAKDYRWEAHKDGILHLFRNQNRRVIAIICAPQKMNFVEIDMSMQLFARFYTQMSEKKSNAA